ncbi:MAG: DegV family protein [Anaerolineales bacterium]
MTLHILTDSTADLGSDLAAEFGVDVIPLTVTLGENAYLDGVEIDQQKLFDLVAQVGTLPKTAAPSVGEFARFFERDGESIFIGISSNLSATIQNARLAAAEKGEGRVRVIDSLNLSTGIGLLVLRAAELRAAGRSAAEIEQDILACVPKVRTSFIIDTMEYLYKGGRCSALQALAGSVLKIHPIIEVRADGTLGVKGKARGSRERGLQMMLDDFAADLERLDRRRVFITHTACPQDAEFLKQEILRLAAPDEVRITLAGSVISSHCGPATIGILYMLK